MPFLKEKHHYTTEALCIKSMDFGEADKILHFYSPQVGRIGAIAKGSRRQKSRLAGACIPLNISELHLAKGRNLDVLCQYQSMESFPGIRQDLLRLAYALLFVELVDLLATEHDLDSAMIYHALKRALYRLPDVRERPVQVAVCFQMGLLDAAGYSPVFTGCMLCSRELFPFREAYLPFSPHLGGVICPDCRHEVSASTVVNVSAATLAALHQPENTGAWVHADERKVQKFLAFYFSDKLEKRMKACEFLFQQLDAEAGGSVVLQEQPLCVSRSGEFCER